MQEDFDKIEEELIQKDQESRKEKMPVSGRSVFELQRIRRNQAGKSAQADNKPTK